MSPLTAAQAEAHLAGLACRVGDAVDAHNADSTLVTMQAAIDATREHRAALVRYYGVDCPACGGRGEVDFDLIPASHAGPQEIVPETCSACRGEGRVLPKEREGWLAVHDATSTEEDR